AITFFSLCYWHDFNGKIYKALVEKPALDKFQMIMDIRKYWSPFFWGTFIYALVGQFTVVLVLQSYGQKGVD
ncbi:hypothetical protein, partial [Pseudoalteromonas maricaloris]|uniref:hypothetical protein n=1 Tax=Pseudoalteromonas maricaloris TaxID=184924 RepID=UPI001286AF0F